MDNFRLRFWLALGGIVLAVIWVTPNFIDTTKVWWPSKQKINYGLDIQGGLHLVMGVDIDGVVSEGIQRLSVTAKDELTKKSISVADIKVTQAHLGEIQVLYPPSEKEKVHEFFNEQYASILQKMDEKEGSTNYQYYETYLLDFKNKVLSQAIETIRNRIDEFGVAEPSIAKQGDDRIIIQLPGMADAEKAKKLINTAAKLSFMLVEEKDPAELQTLIAEAEKSGGYSLEQLKYTEYLSRLNKDLASKLPADTAIYFEKDENAANLTVGKIPMLLKTNTGLGGDSLTDAYVTFNEYGAPEVAIRFDSIGANKFKLLTGQNVGRRMAIVLDGVIKTAPNIKDEIGGGNAVITLGTRDREKTLEEAKMISTALRAGSLPATLEQLEERRVGPSLGMDSIRQAKIATLVGSLAVIIFMLIYYRSMGAIADISLMINLLALFALLSSLGATLTLPGIAGIALTVGFAVDANVLIIERIREEMKKGSGFMSAMKEGYHRALSAIIDSNITTAATAAILLYFGTGPVRGFAVTLLVGIVTTLFANVFVSKVILDVLIHKFGVRKLST